MSTDTTNLNKKILEKKLREKTEDMMREEEMIELEDFEQASDMSSETDEIVLEEFVQLEEEKQAFDEEEEMISLDTLEETEPESSVKEEEPELIQPETEEAAAEEATEEIPIEEDVKETEPADLTEDMPEEIIPADDSASEEAVSEEIPDEEPVKAPEAEAENYDEEFVAELDEMQEENRKQKEDLKKLKKAAGIKEKGKGRKKWIAIIIAVLLAACFAVYMLMPHGNTFSQTAKIGDSFENDRTRCAVKDIVVIDQLLDSKASEGKTFICVSYQYKNTSSEELTYEDLPLLSVCGYESDTPGKRPKLTVGNSSINKKALQSYSYISGTDLETEMDPLKAGEVREDIDVFEVDESIFDKYSMYVTFDLYDSGIKIEKDKMNKLPSMKETIKKQKKKIKKEQKKKGITN